MRPEASEGTRGARTHGGDNSPWKCSDFKAAAEALRTHGWCLLSISPSQYKVIEAVNRCAAEFFALPLDAKIPLRNAAVLAGSDQTETHSSARKARMRVATAGVGFLSGPTREWFHLAADPATLDRTQWPNAAFQESVLKLLRILESTCADVLEALGETSVAVRRQIAVMEADRERWGDPSVLDLFHYRDLEEDDNQAEGSDDSQYAMGSHTDPGLLTITPCSAVPALEVQDNTSGDWVKAEVPSAQDLSDAHSNNRLLLFGGDSLEDCGCVAAAAHRVRRTESERLSLVYEMRRWEQDHLGICPVDNKRTKRGT